MITSVPDQVSVTEVVKAVYTEMALKAPSKMNHFVYDHNKGDFKGLRSFLRAANVWNLISPDATSIDGEVSVLMRH